jgi:hypothetical protein
MRKVLIAVFLLLPGQAALAGPPEGASGEMAIVDPVADGLRKFRKEKDPDKRGELIEKLARTRDPRVALVLGEALGQGPGARDFDNLEVPVILLAIHYVPKKGALADPLGGLSGNDVAKWWKQNEADLRRQAKQLRP